MEINKLSDEFVRLLQRHEEGIDDTKVKEHFPTRHEQLQTVINNLLEQNRLQLFKRGEILVYKLISEDKVLKFEGLGPEQMHVYQIIEQASNKGIWTRDIKLATNIQQQTLTKTLKLLEQRSLIKSVRSVVSKSKKLYMLYNLEPSKEISGGPWYTDQEFDHGFIEAVSMEILHCVESKNMADMETIAERIRTSGITTVELANEDVDAMIQTLVYDGRLEEVRSAVAMMTGNSSGSQMYKIAKSTPKTNYYTDVPCGVCPIIDRCFEGGVISPQSCLYMKEWLSGDDVW